MNIYEKLLEILAKNPNANVFEEEARLGMEDIAETLEAKRKESEGVKAHPAESDYVLAALEEKIRNALTGKYRVVALETPPAEVAADFAMPCFRLAKEQKKNPADLAKEMTGIITEARIEGVAHVEASGGYVNVELDKNKLGTAVLREIGKWEDAYGASREGAGKTIVVEYSSPNAAKPMSVGHLRSTIIGESLKRIYELGGYSVIGINHFGDFGTQFGKFLYAYFAWKDEKAYTENPVHEMLRLYVKFHDEAEKNPELEEKARELFRKLEHEDAELAKIWLASCYASTLDADAVYRELGVRIDLLLGESFYENRLAQTLERCLAQSIAVKNEDGSVAVNFADESLPSFLLAKKDGSSLYALRDMAAAIVRLETMHPAKIVYVVGGEQTLHFRQVFKTLGLLGYSLSLFAHDGFGLVSLPEGKMSTRKGRVVFLNDVIAEGRKRAQALVEAKNPDLSEEEKTEIAHAVGVGALVYDDLSQSRERNITFSWDRALSMEGDSAPYIQYGYARAGSILKKSGEEVDLKKISDSIIATKQETRLVQLLARFPHAVRQARVSDAPHIIAVYANTLVQEFNRFYNEDEVLTAQGNVKTTRLALVKATMQVIKNALALLNIKTLERM